MWQIQWMLSLIPDFILNWIYWGIIAAGLTGLFAGWLGRWIPFYGNYVKILKPVGIALLVLGVWLRGGYDVEMAWRAKVEALEGKIKQSEEQSRAANDKLANAVKERDRAIQGAVAAARGTIRDQAANIDKECKLDPKVVPLLNQLADDPAKAKK